MSDANLTHRGIRYSIFSKLTEITLTGSGADWLSLLPFSQLPSLRRLRLESMYKIERVGHENYCYCLLHLGGDDIRNSSMSNNAGFPCLEELIFEDMRKWKEWSGVTDGDFLCLRRLTIRDCNKLRSFPLLPSSLKTLHIFRCNSLESLPVNNEQVKFPYMEELVFEDMPAWEEWPGLHSGDFPCLRRLTIRRCNKLRRFPLLPSSRDENLIGQQGVGFPCLEKLLIEYVSEWEEWSGVMDGDFPCLRKLTLRNCPSLSQIPTLPSSLKTLHIFRCNSLESLPVNNEQVKFPYMEELVFEDMPAWEEWPGLNSGDFPCLRRLTIRRCNKLRRFPLLPSSRDENLIGQQGVGFPCLEKLLIEYVSEWEEWSGVMDGDFPCLRKLTLRNCPSLSQIPTLPSSLRTLHIFRCNSLMSLPVNNEQVRFPYMEELVFEDMPAWEEWPGLNGGDFPCLRRLTIRRCNKLRRFSLLPSSRDENLIGQQGVGFPCLEKLLIEYVSEWEEWSGVMDGDFPCLRKLTLRNCPSLSQIPTLPSSLRTLHIFHCNSLMSLPVNNEQVRFPYMEELVFDDMPAWEERPGLNSGDFPCLRRLTIRVCNKLRRFPLLPSSRDENLIGQQGVGFPCLEKLLIEYVSEWEEWSGVMDGDFPCLRKLTLRNCPSLSQIPTLPSSLRTLHIFHCNSLMSLPVNNEQVRFPYMEELVFDDMPAWEEWPGLNSGDFPCLRRLTIRDCNKLRRFPLLPSSRDENLIGQQEVGFPCLEELLFQYMSEWKEWSGVMDGDFPCLRKLTLRNCPSLSQIPTLSSSLKTLHISDCYSLKSLPVNNEQVRFPYMEELVFDEMPAWEEWPGLNSGDFPCLRRLTIRDCNKLRRFLLLPSSRDENLIGQQEVGFPCLEELLFQYMWEWKEWSGVMDGDFPCLRKLTLRNCPSLSQIPMLPSSLKTLHISDCNRLKSLPVNNEQVKFPYMEELVFEDMPAWEGWPGLKSGDFPCLRRLTIGDCNKLRRFPLLPSSLDENHRQKVGFPCLEELLIEYVSEWEEWSGVMDGDFPCLHKLTLSRCPSLSQIPALSSSLKTLHISHCSSLKSLPVNNEQVGFPCLEEMVLEDVPELQQVWFGVSNGYFPCLRKLSINNCQQLQGFPALSSSFLKDLFINSCWSLTSLTGLQNLTSLESLKLYGCPSLHISLQELLSSKPRHVDIVDCPLLQEWCHVHQFNFIQTYFPPSEVTIYRRRKITDFGVDRLASLKKLIVRISETNLFSDGWLPPMIQILQIYACYNLLYLSLRSNLPSLSLHPNVLLLKSLHIWNCPVLASVDGLNSLPNLEELSLESCPKLQFTTDESLPSSLQSLKVKDCMGLRSLPLLPEKLSSLEDLEVFYCPELTIVAGLCRLSSLKSLKIWHCPGLSLSSNEQLSSMPHRVSIAHCPALRGWCEQQNIPYN